MASQFGPGFAATLGGLEPDDFVFMPGRISDGAGIVHRTLKRMTRDGYRPTPDLARLRSSWIDSLLKAGTPLDVVCEVAGLKNLAGYGQWVQDTAAHRARAMRELVHGKLYYALQGYHDGCGYDDMPF